MDWSLVIERLRAIGNTHTEQANKYSWQSGYSKLVEQHRLASDIFIGLAAALNAGLRVHDLDKLVEGITEENRHPEY